MLEVSSTSLQRVYRITQIIFRELHVRALSCYRQAQVLWCRSDSGEYRGILSFDSLKSKRNDNDGGSSRPGVRGNARALPTSSTHINHHTRHNEILAIRNALWLPLSLWSQPESEVFVSFSLVSDLQENMPTFDWGRFRVHTKWAGSHTRIPHTRPSQQLASTPFGWFRLHLPTRSSGTLPTDTPEDDAWT